MKNKIVNLCLALVAIAILGITALYYRSYWEQTASAQELSRQATESNLPEGHPAIGNQKFPAEGQYCLTCHQGIEPTRPLESEMMQQILAQGTKLGDPNGCVVCHGGTPNETVDKDRAHRGAPQGSKLKTFTPVPAALQVNEHTCGQCHADHTYNVHRSIMNTDAGKMKAITWSFGIDTDNKDHVYGDHDMDDPDGASPRFGTEVYKNYMKEMALNFPGQYPSTLKQIPQTSVDKLEQLPHEAAFSYLRNCNACHLSNKGMQDRGHFRGMGCAACHNLYSNEGYYEGGDPSIDRKKPGHVMVHSMQGSRKSATHINGALVSGVQVSTCAACHAAGRRIGHAYQGFMALESSNGKGPFDENGMPQKTNAGYVFKHMRSDAHHRIEKDGQTVTGLLCQDCHTTNAMHGNGNIGATTLATIEIECADCHGTPTHYPWELPIGYGDEFGKKLNMDQPRGVADQPLKVTQDFGIVYPRKDGYILSSRGNPLGNVVRSGNKVIVHSDGGHDFEVPVLKDINATSQWQHPDKAITAMVRIPQHMDKLECYACHSTWVPQYYGYKYVMDFTQKSIDWLASPEVYGTDGTTADYHKQYVMQDGLSTRGDYSHIRWENAPLGINGEGRVTPLVGVIQTVSTVIDKQGKVVAWNQVAKTQEGYNAMELAPVNPHTTSLESRECADCHGNTTAMGLGIDQGQYDASPEEPRYADVVGVDGKNVSQFTQAQIAAIKGLHGDFMQIVNEKGEQVQTVDSHWPTSMPLTAEQRNKLARGGTCMACHQDIPDGAIPIRMLGKIAEITNLSFASDEAHGALLQENNLLISWVKALGIVLLCISLIVGIAAFFVRKKIIALLRHILESIKHFFRNKPDEQ